MIARRRIVWVVVVSALTLAGWFSLAQRPAGTRPIPVPSEHGSTGSESPSPALDPAHALVPEVGGERHPATAGRESEAILPHWPRTLRGRLELASSSGEPLLAERGGLVFGVTASNGRPGRELRARIENNGWTLDVDGPCRLEPLRLEVNTSSPPKVTRRATPAPLTIDAEVEQVPVIRAWIDTGPRLHVLDRLTREHVSGLAVVLANLEDSPYSLEAESPPPGSEPEPGFTSVTSPIEFPSRPGTLVGWVRTPSASWKRFALAACDQTVYLDPGGALEVHVQGLLPEHGQPVVRVLGEPSPEWGDRLLAEQRVRSGEPLRFHGLPPGTARLRVERIGLSRPSGTIVEAVAQIQVGVITPVVLDCAAGANAMGRIGIRLLRPPSIEVFPAGGLTIIVEDAARPRLSEEFWLDPGNTTVDDQSLTWRSPLLRSGAYVASVLPLGLSAHVSLIPGQVAWVELQLQSPVPIEVAFTSQASGAPVYGADLLVRPLHSRAPIAWREVQADRAAKLYRFRAQPGEIQVVLPGSGRDSQVHTLRIEPPRSRHDLTLPAVMSVESTLEATVDGSPRILPSSFWEAIAVEPLDSVQSRLLGRRILGEHVGASRALDSAACELTLSAPGRYLVHVPHWPGYRPVEPILLDTLASTQANVPLTLE